MRGRRQCAIIPPPGTKFAPFGVLNRDCPAAAARLGTPVAAPPQPTRGGGILPRLLAALALLLAAAALWLAAGTPSLFGQSTIDYDTDNDGLIEISNFAQFNAMRYDQDGNGDRTSVPFLEAPVNAAFPNRERGPEQGRTWTGNWFGCPSSFCSGFELMADIVPPTTGTRNFLPIPPAARRLWPGGYAFPAAGVGGRRPTGGAALPLAAAQASRRPAR